MTRPLRHTVLRPHQPPEALVYPGDDATDTVHFGAFAVGGRGDGGKVLVEARGEVLVGVASLYREPLPDDRAPLWPDEVPPGSAWRLRGMAVAPEHRGRSLGALLVEGCAAHARERGAVLLWCNARTTAAGFYARLGWAPLGPDFELPGIGPHRVMVRAAPP